MEFTLEKQGEYSRLNFWMRLILVYYVLYMVHLFLNLGYSIALFCASALNMLVGFVTGQRHPELTEFCIKGVKWSNKTGLAMAGFVENIPNIDVNKECNDRIFRMQINTPAAVTRTYALLRITGIVAILLIPHLLYLLVLAIAYLVLYLIGFFAILFTGRWLDLTFDFAVKFVGYATKINCYMLGLSEGYPSFNFGIK